MVDQPLGNSNEHDDIPTEGDNASEGAMDINTSDSGLCRSQRLRRPNSKYLDPSEASGAYWCKLSFTIDFFTDIPGPVERYAVFKATIKSSVKSHQAKLQFFEETVNLNYDRSINNLHPLSYATQSVDNECYHFLHEAMKQPDREDFIRAMEKELADHHDNKHWKLVLHAEIEDGIKPIKAIWSF